MKAAIATVVIGESYRRHYAQIFQPSVQRYAKRHGYDLLLFDQHLCAPELRHSSTVDFTKLLIPVQPAVQAYERLMVLDADILIHRDTPPFTTLDLDTGIGIVDEWSQPTPAERVAYQQALGLETRPRDYYALAGFTLETRRRAEWRDVHLFPGLPLSVLRGHGAAADRGPSAPSARFPLRTVGTRL